MTENCGSINPVMVETVTLGSISDGTQTYPVEEKWIKEGSNIPQARHLPS